MARVKYIYIAQSDAEVPITCFDNSVPYNAMQCDVESIEMEFAFMHRPLRLYQIIHYYMYQHLTLHPIYRVFNNALTFFRQLQ